MKNSSLIRSVAVGMLISVYTLGPGQGPLNPPGPPSPMMKTLDQVEPSIPISSLPTTIDQPGSYYLTGKLTGAAGSEGIIIAADDVSIDLRGYSLQGVAESLSGISCPAPHTRLRIENGSIVSWGGKGIDTLNASDAQYRSLNVSDNGSTGIDAGSRSLVSQVIATNNDNGGIGVGQQSIVRDCIASDNARSGIWAGGPGALIENCTASGNVTTDSQPEIDAGIGLYVGAESAIIRNCLSTGNNSHGIQVLNHACKVEGNISSGNHNDGFAAAGIQIGNTSWPSTRCLVVGNSIIGNDLGISVKNTPDRTTGNLIIQNTLSGNSSAFTIEGKNSYAPFIDVTGLTAFASTDPNANLIH